MISESVFLDLVKDKEKGVAEEDQDYSSLLVNSNHTGNSINFGMNRGRRDEMQFNTSALSNSINASLHSSSRGSGPDLSLPRNRSVASPSPSSSFTSRGTGSSNLSNRSGSSLSELNNQNYTSLLVNSLSGSNTQALGTPRSFNHSTPVVSRARPNGRAIDAAEISVAQAHTNELNRIIREKTCEKHCAKEVVIVEYLENLFKTMTLINKDELERLREKDSFCKAQECEIEKLKKAMERGRSDVAEAIEPKLNN